MNSKESLLALVELIEKQNSELLAWMEEHQIAASVDRGVVHTKYHGDSTGHIQLLNVDSVSDDIEVVKALGGSEQDHSKNFNQVCAQLGNTDIMTLVGKEVN